MHPLARPSPGPLAMARRCAICGAGRTHRGETGWASHTVVTPHADEVLHLHRRTGMVPTPMPRPAPGNAFPGAHLLAFSRDMLGCCVPSQA